MLGAATRPLDLNVLGWFYSQARHVDGLVVRGERFGVDSLHIRKMGEEVLKRCTASYGKPVEVDIYPCKTVASLRCGDTSQ